VDKQNVTINFTGFLAIIVALFLIKDCSNRETANIEAHELHSVLCIAESGDTVACFNTYQRPHIWSGYDGLTVATFSDTTGRRVELRTRGGTIIWQ
jgi:hypothetical protein